MKREKEFKIYKYKISTPQKIKDVRYYLDFLQFVTQFLHQILLNLINYANILNCHRY